MQSNCRAFSTLCLSAGAQLSMVTSMQNLCRGLLVSQSARKICSLSLDHAMTSMLSANRRNIFPPPTAIVTMLCAKKSSKKGLDTRYNFSELSSLKPFNYLVMVHARACALVI